MSPRWGFCSIIDVFYDYFTPLGLLYALHFVDAQPFERFCQLLTRLKILYGLKMLNP
jgi:hypothetical protein